MISFEQSGATEHSIEKYVAQTEEHRTALYSAMLTHNRKLLELLQAAWNLIDPADMPTFQDFLLTVNRLVVAEGVKKALPPIHYTKLVKTPVADVQLHNPEFASFVNRRIAVKNDELADLRGFPTGDLG